MLGMIRREVQTGHEKSNVRHEKRSLDRSWRTRC